MMEGFPGAESASNLSRSRAERVRHSYSYGFCVLTQLCGKGGVLCVLKTPSSWEYWALSGLGAPVEGLQIYGQRLIGCGNDQLHNSLALTDG
jgi:hypothetical protein